MLLYWVYAGQSLIKYIEELEKKNEILFITVTSYAAYGVKAMSAIIKTQPKS